VNLVGRELSEILPKLFDRFFATASKNFWEVDVFVIVGPVRQKQALQGLDVSLVPEGVLRFLSDRVEFFLRIGPGSRFYVLEEPVD